jgi:hypothetical protein
MVLLCTDDRQRLFGSPCQPWVGDMVKVNATLVSPVKFDLTNFRPSTTWIFGLER